MPKNLHLCSCGNRKSKYENTCVACANLAFKREHPEIFNTDNGQEVVIVRNGNTSQALLEAISARLNHPRTVVVG